MQSLTISLIHEALVKQNSQLGIFEDASLTLEKLEKGITANWAGGASQKLVFLWPGSQAGSQDSAEMGVSFCREFVGSFLPPSKQLHLPRPSRITAFQCL